MSLGQSKNNFEIHKQRKICVKLSRIFAYNILDGIIYRSILIIYVNSNKIKQ